MPLDPITLAFTIIAFLGGLIAVPIGGSFLLVIPAFLFLGLDGLETLVLARIFMIAAMGSSSAYFLTRQQFDWQKILIFLTGNLIGYTLAAKLATSIDIALLTKLVPWVLLIGAIFLIKDYQIKKPQHRAFFLRSLPLFGLLFGFYAGLGGGGNGKMIVLLLTLTLGWKIHRAIINTRLIEFVGNILAVAAYLYFGAHLTGFEIPVILAAALGGLIGAKIVLKTKPQWLKYAFLLLVLASAIKLTFW